MPYILYKTDGSKLTTVGDATLDTTTDLAFVGRNYSGYGQVVNENFLKLLENFSSETKPAKPIRGQLWFDKANGRLNVSYDGRNFKGIASIFVQNTSPSNNALVRGDLWWDSNNFQLKAFDGSQFQVIGPFNPAAGRATWIPGEESRGDDTAITLPISKATIDQEVVAIVSRDSFTATVTSNIIEDFPRVRRGITLANVSSTGTSAESGTLLWGSASHALKADTSTFAAVAYELVTGGAPSLRSERVAVSYSVASTSSIAWTIVERDSVGDVSANLFKGIATSARYADLAERYHADADYDKGTVLVIGGKEEVTVTTVRADTAVIGVVSTNPGYMLNTDAGPDSTHPFVAIRGRVPCRVIGPVSKGDLLVTSSISGHAEVWTDGDQESAVFAKSLESVEKGTAIIEVVII